MDIGLVASSITGVLADGFTEKLAALAMDWFLAELESEPL